MKRIVTIFFLVIFFGLLIGMIAQKKSHDYVFTITVEGKSDDEGEKILDKLYQFCEDNKVKFDLYQKKDYEKRMVIPDFKIKSK